MEGTGAEETGFEGRLGGELKIVDDAKVAIVIFDFGGLGEVALGFVSIADCAELFETGDGAPLGEFDVVSQLDKAFELGVAGLFVRCDEHVGDLTVDVYVDL